MSGHYRPRLEIEMSSVAFYAVDVYRLGLGATGEIAAVRDNGQSREVQSLHDNYEQAGEACRQLANREAGVAREYDEETDTLTNVGVEKVKWTFCQRLNDLYGDDPKSRQGWDHAFQVEQETA